jgi:hypothetical protein
MKTFDYVVGNPPYNKLIYIPFFKVALDHMVPGGICHFITPATFMMAPRHLETRELILNDNDVEIIDRGTGGEAFGVCLFIRRVVTLKITKGIGTSLNVNGLSVEPNDFPDRGIPLFSNQVDLDCYKDAIQSRGAIVGKKADTAKWRAKTSCVHLNWKKIPPNIPSEKTWDILYDFETEAECDDFIKYMKSDLVKKFVDGTIMNNNLNRLIRVLPKVPE